MLIRIGVGLLFCAAALAQANPAPSATAVPAKESPSKELIIPSGTKVPIALKGAISTKNSREGDSVYAETTFPVLADGRILIPAGTYVQGRISHIQRAGHIKGR